MSDEKNVKKVDDPFEMLSKLASIGKKTRKVKLDTLEITFETLSAENEGNIFANISSLEGQEYFLRHKIETITYAISEINGKSLKDYEKIEDVTEKIRVKKETLEKIRTVISSWNDALIDYAYEQFNLLIVDSEADMIKLGIMKKIETETKE